MNVQACFKKFGLFAASAFCMTGALMAVPPAVLADDTEVFFPDEGSGNEDLVKPNIMFILDTSGSMIGSGSFDGTGETRLKRMQDAFSTIVGNLSPNVNIGLMKFSGRQGGPVLFPVAPIDAFVDDVDTTATGDRALMFQISDAFSEANQQVGGTVTLQPATLTLRGGTTSSSNTRLALRFTNVAIPRGVALSSANIQFAHKSSGSNSTALAATIRIENTGDAAPYVAANNNISGRATSGTTVSWTNVGIANGGATGSPVTTDRDDYVTPNIASLLNAVISRTDWCGGNSISIIIEGSSASTAGIRNMFGSADTAEGALAPTLNLSYDPDTSANQAALVSGCINRKLGAQISVNADNAIQTNDDTAAGCGPLYLSRSRSSSSPCGANNRATTVGLRFQNLNVPVNSTVLSATLQVTASEASSSSPTLLIKAEKNNNPNGFSTSSNNNQLTNRYDNAGNTTGEISRTTTAWTSGQVVSLDVTSLVQTVVSQGNWAAKDPIVFFIKGSGASGTQKPIHSRNTNAGQAPRLLVTIQGPAERLKVRDFLIQQVNEFEGAGGTPTMGALYEAARYLRGEDAFYGRTRSGGTEITQSEVDGIGTSIVADLRLSGRATFDYSVSSTVPPDRPAGCTETNLGSTTCNLEKWTGVRRYKSPITHGCQSNNIILLSDGEPNSGGVRSGDSSPNNKSAEELIGDLIGDDSCVGAVTTNTSSTRTLCGRELTTFLFSQDQVSDSRLAGDQSIKTHTIAFGADVESPTSVGGSFLRGLSEGGGGGRFYSATSTAQVAAAFDAIISDILDQGTTFVAPAVTVNTFNRLTNRNELYFALFTPSGGVNWRGNLKRYELKQLTGSGQPQIYDQLGALAVDASTGFFNQNACSFWTPSCADGARDGADVAKGGAASKLNTSRKVYTSMGGVVDLTASSNRVSETNVAAFSNTVLGLESTATQEDREAILKWARGIDTLDDDGDDNVDEARLALGDPLHSEPTLISYGGTDANPDLALFYGDNHGYLHAIKASVADSTGGTEYFSFIPEELLDNLHVYYEGSGTHEERPYGMDGPMSTYINDPNRNGSVDTGETATLFVGMRRGGRSYYALDVSDRNAPKLKFRIAGGTNSALQGDFRELSETWSSPIVANIRFNDKNYDGKSGQGPALIFTGGYDDAQDGKTNLFTSPTARNGDSKGRGIFVVDASTGKLLWWAGHNGTATPNLNFKTGTDQDMVYSVPATPSVIDLDGDGFIDRMYIADAGGQVFRVILGKDGSNKPSLSNATGSIIAKLAVEGVAGARRFFNTPDVSLITEGVSKPFLAISIGTGHREKPKSSGTQDRFYVLKDPDISNDSVTSLLINGDSDLYDATANLAGSADAVIAKAAREAIAAKKGLYLNLGGGEKSLTESTTFNNQVIFATFTPSVSGDACTASTGQSRFYQINITDATPVQNFDGVGSDTVLTASDRSKTIVVAGLPPDPIILFPSIRLVTNPDGSTTPCNGPGCTDGRLVNPVVCTGAVCFNLNNPRQVKKSYWRKIE